MRTKLRLVVFVFALSAGLAACGGGGGGGGTPTVAPPVNQGGGPPATGTMTIDASPPLDDTSYASYQGSTLGYTVRLLSVNGVANASAPALFGCLNGAANQVCVSAPAGNDVFSILYADSKSGPLAYAQFSAAITPSANATVPVSLLGIPAAYHLDVPAAFGAGSSTASFAVTDANNDECKIELHQCSFVPLTGTYAAGVTISDSDTSGATLLTLDGGAPSRTVTVTKASDQVAIVIAQNATVDAQLNVTGNWSFNEFGVSGSVAAAPTQSTVTFVCKTGSCYETGSGVIGISSR